MKSVLGILPIIMFSFSSMSVRADSIGDRISNYKACVNRLAADHFDWLEAFAACGAGNRADTAETCMADFNRQFPGWNQLVVAMACAGGSQAGHVQGCMMSLSDKYGNEYDPSITNSACSGSTQVGIVGSCMSGLMNKYGNVIAGMVCGGDNTAAKADQCLSAFPVMNDIFYAEACSGGNTSQWVAECMKEAQVSLVGLANTSGQEERAASYACATSALNGN